MSDARLIVISVDGLRASALGAYGNTWYATPAMDQLAADATVYSQLLAKHWEPDTLWQDLWGVSANGSHTPLIFGSDDHAAGSLLVTDDDGLAAHPGAQAFENAVLVPAYEPESAASSADETGMAATLSALLDAVESSSGEHAPRLAWCHLRFAAGPWDAPLDLIEGLLDEDDPTPTPDVAPPAGNLSELENPDDARFLATLRYAAQVMAFDQCLGMVNAALDSLLSDQAYTLAVLGAGGLGLGEHGRLGADPRPYNECRQLPLLVRRNGARHHRRRRGLFTSADVPSLLRGESTPQRGHAILQSHVGDALQDEQWKLYLSREGEPELYSKPDDAWEMNDVAIRQPNQVEQLQQQLAAALATASEKPA